MQARRFVMAAAVVAAAVCVASAQVKMIPPTGDHTQSRALAMTPDGKYVVGLSYTASGDYNNGQAGLLWNAGSGSRTLTDGTQSLTMANGVGYRKNGANETELVVGGRLGLRSSSTTPNFADFHAVDTGTAGSVNGTIYERLRPTDSAKLGQPQLYNTLRVSANQDTYYAIGSNGTAVGNFEQGFWRGTFSGNAPTMAYEHWYDSNLPQKYYLTAIASTGRAGGYGRILKGDNTNYRYYIDPGTSTFTQIKGQGQDLFGSPTNAGEILAISGNGRYVFGDSTAPGDYPRADMYDVDTGQLHVLPRLPDPDAAAGKKNTLGRPWATNESGSFAGGMNFVHFVDPITLVETQVEKAVLWNLSDPDPAKWTILDLTNYFTAAGQMNGFIRLSRVYSISDDGMTISGEGVWSPDGGTTRLTRGWIVTIPEPATLTLLALGGLVLRRRKA